MRGINVLVVVLIFNSLFVLSFLLQLDESKIQSNFFNSSLFFFISSFGLMEYDWDDLKEETTRTTAATEQTFVSIYFFVELKQQQQQKVNKVWRVLRSWGDFKLVVFFGLSTQ